MPTKTRDPIQALAHGAASRRVAVGDYTLSPFSAFRLIQRLLPEISDQVLIEHNPKELFRLSCLVVRLLAIINSNLRPGHDPFLASPEYASALKSFRSRSEGLQEEGETIVLQ